MPYLGRPGLSPAVAALVALGRIRRRHAILDVGCGTGTDALLLAAWGARDVTGVDADAKAVAVARARATRLRLRDHVRLEPWPAEDLVDRFGARRFDVVLHTLVANNLRDGLDDHFRNVAEVLRDDGLLVLHERVTKRDAAQPPGAVQPLDEVRRRFRLTPGVTTQLAELPGGRGPPFARVALWLGTPRRKGSRPPRA